MTYSFAMLEISPAAYAEIRAKLKDAGYTHLLGRHEIDMQGIAVVEDPALATVPTKDIGLCRVGVHVWPKWSAPAEFTQTQRATVIETGREVEQSNVVALQQRTCSRCGRFERLKVVVR